MDKEEFRIKLEEINKLVERKDYQGAMEIVDSIDWRRVKNVRTLCVVGEIYAANKKYEDSKEIFLLAYHRAPIGKTILYRLIEVSLKMGDLEEAEEFYDEFLEVAPNDNTKFILYYKILSAKKAPLDEQISVLEDYKEHEYTERWSYELAKLYYKAGNKEKCIEVCDDLVLWFNEGKYVTKALDLKMRLGALTESQKRQYEEALTPKLRSKEELEKNVQSREESTGTEPQIESIRIPKPAGEESGIRETTGMFQEKIARGIKDIFSGKREDSAEEEIKKPEKEEQEDEAIENMLEDHVNKDDIPQLEPEETGSSKRMENIPEEIKIPSSIKIPEPVKAPELVAAPVFVPTQEEIDAAIEADKQNQMYREEKKNPEPAEIEEPEQTRNFEFNLEDTILAAASAQGIELPEETEVQEENKIQPVMESETETEQEENFQKTAEEVPALEEEAPEEIVKEPEENEPEEAVLEEPEEEPATLEESEDLAEEEQTEEEIPAVPEPEIGDLEEKIIQSFQEEEKKEESEEERLERFIDDRNAAEVNPLYLIPREMKLTDEEKKLFTYFSSIPGIPEQLVDALADVQQAAAEKTSKTGNVIIMGGLQTGKTRLSQGFILAACKELHMEAVKTANISGKQLNELEPAEVVDKLAGGFLVIQDAASMTAETIDKLNKAMEFRTDGLTVIIEDEKIGMRKLIAKYEKFAEKFTSMINIPVFTNDELVRFAKIYTKENGYVMDQMGVLALYNLIGDNQKEDEPMTIGKVKEMLDDAINRAESGTRKFKRNLSNKRTDADGRVILYEKDFG